MPLPAMLRIALIAAGTYASSVAYAGWVTESDSALAIRLAAALRTISAAELLSPREEGFVTRMAVTWFYLGPCEGDSRKIPENSFAAIQLVGDANSTTPVGRAILLMIGHLERESFGRKPSEQMCRIAFEIAVPLEESTGP